MLICPSYEKGIRCYKVQWTRDYAHTFLSIDNNMAVRKGLHWTFKHIICWQTVVKGGRMCVTLLLYDNRKTHTNIPNRRNNNKTLLLLLGLFLGFQIITNTICITSFPFSFYFSFPFPLHFVVRHVLMCLPENRIRWFHEVQVRNWCIRNNDNILEGFGQLMVGWW